MNGGYWGAVGVRGAVRDKIKRQESREKEDAAFKKKVKTEFANRSVKSPNIKVENILSKISPKPKLQIIDKSDNEEMVKSLLHQMIDSLEIIEKKEKVEKLSETKSDRKLEELPILELKNKIVNDSDERTSATVNKCRKNSEINSDIFETRDTVPLQKDSIDESQGTDASLTSDSLTTVENTCETKKSTHTEVVSKSMQSPPIVNKTVKLEESKETEKVATRRRSSRSPTMKKFDVENGIDASNSKGNKRSASELNEKKNKKPRLSSDAETILKDTVDEKIESGIPSIEQIKDSEISVTVEACPSNEVFNYKNLECQDVFDDTIEEEFTSHEEVNDSIIGDDSNESENTTQENSIDEGDEDIWSSINEQFHDIKKMQLDMSNNKKKLEESEKSQKVEVDEVDSLNCSFDGWPIGCDLKDEITEEDNDVWEDTNNLMASINEKISNEKAKQMKTDNISRFKGESSNRKSRQLRKQSDETLGNPDSGKENADVETSYSSKKNEKNHSPASKRRKNPNRKYFNDDFEDNNVPHKGTKRNSIDSIKSEGRGRSISSSTDDGSEFLGLESDHGLKVLKSPLYSNPLSKKIKLIDPSPVDPEALLENKSVSHKTHQQKDLSKVSAKNKNKADRISEKSVKSSNKPSKILIDIFDKKYEKARKTSSSKSKS